MHTRLHAPKNGCHRQDQVVAQFFCSCLSSRIASIRPQKAIIITERMEQRQHGSNKSGKRKTRVGSQSKEWTSAILLPANQRIKEHDAGTKKCWIFWDKIASYTWNITRASSFTLYYGRGGEAEGRLGHLKNAANFMSSSCKNALDVICSMTRGSRPDERNVFRSAAKPHEMSSNHTRTYTHT